jgi:molecular chaperone GrpE
MSENEDKVNENENETVTEKEGQPTAAETPAETPANDQPPAPPTPEEKIAALEVEKGELRDRMLRIAADFDNWKKRSRKDLADAEAKSKEGVLRDLLEVLDNLERAASSFADGKEVEASAVKEGVNLVLRQFQSKLERYQVKPVETKDTAFDPRYHEAISQVPSPDAKPGTIVHELQKGYFIGDRLLRPSMVVVASAAPAKAEPPEKPEESN